MPDVGGTAKRRDPPTRGTALPHRCRIIARDPSAREPSTHFCFSRAARASSGRDRRRRGAFGSMRRDTAGLVRGLGRVLRWRVACRGIFAQGGGRDAVPVYCSAAAANFYHSLGVIADFGDDAGCQDWLNRAPITLSMARLYLRARSGLASSIARSVFFCRPVQISG